MRKMGDHIQDLLLKTGWSLNQLLENIQTRKETLTVPPQASPSSTFTNDNNTGTVIRKTTDLFAHIPSASTNNISKSIPNLDRLSFCNNGVDGNISNVDEIIEINEDCDTSNANVGANASVKPNENGLADLGGKMHLLDNANTNSLTAHENTPSIEAPPHLSILQPKYINISEDEDPLEESVFIFPKRGGKIEALAIKTEKSSESLIENNCHWEKEELSVTKNNNISNNNKEINYCGPIIDLSMEDDDDVVFQSVDIITQSQASDIFVETEGDQENTVSQNEKIPEIKSKDCQILIESSTDEDSLPRPDFITNIKKTSTSTDESKEIADQSVVDKGIENSSSNSASTVILSCEDERVEETNSDSSQRTIVHENSSGTEVKSATVSSQEVQIFLESSTEYSSDSQDSCSICNAARNVSDSNSSINEMDLQIAKEDIMNSAEKEKMESHLKDHHGVKKFELNESKLKTNEVIDVTSSSSSSSEADESEMEAEVVKEVADDLESKPQEETVTNMLEDSLTGKSNHSDNENIFTEDVEKEESSDQASELNSSSSNPFQRMWSGASSDMDAQLAKELTNNAEMEKTDSSSQEQGLSDKENTAIIKHSEIYNEFSDDGVNEDYLDLEKLIELDTTSSISSLHISDADENVSSEMDEQIAKSSELDEQVAKQLIDVSVIDKILSKSQEPIGNILENCQTNLGKENTFSGLIENKKLLMESNSHELGVNVLEDIRIELKTTEKDDNSSENTKEVSVEVEKEDAPKQSEDKALDLTSGTISAEQKLSDSEKYATSSETAKDCLETDKMETNSQMKEGNCTKQLDENKVSSEIDEQVPKEVIDSTGNEAKSQEEGLLKVLENNGSDLKTNKGVDAEKEEDSGDKSVESSSIAVEQILPDLEDCGTSEVDNKIVIEVIDNSEDEKMEILDRNETELKTNIKSEKIEEETPSNQSKDNPLEIDIKPIFPDADKPSEVAPIAKDPLEWSENDLIENFLKEASTILENITAELKTEENAISMSIITDDNVVKVNSSGTKSLSEKRVDNVETSAEEAKIIEAVTEIQESETIDPKIIFISEEELAVQDALKVPVIDITEDVANSSQKITEEKLVEDAEQRGEPEVEIVEPNASPVDAIPEEVVKEDAPTSDSNKEDSPSSNANKEDVPSSNSNKEGAPPSTDPATEAKPEEASIPKEKYLSVKDFKQLSDTNRNPNFFADDLDDDSNHDLVIDLPEDEEADKRLEAFDSTSTSSKENMFEKEAPFMDLDEQPNSKKSPLADVDSIRDNIRLQLSSLRKRKKSFILEDFNTKKLDETLSLVKKPRLMPFVQPEPVLNANDENMLYTQTNNEFGIKILDVQGGVEDYGPKTPEKVVVNPPMKPILTPTNLLNRGGVRMVKLNTNQLTVLDPKTPFVRKLLTNTAVKPPPPPPMNVLEKPVIYKKDNKFYVLKKHLVSTNGTDTINGALDQLRTIINKKDKKKPSSEVPMVTEAVEKPVEVLPPPLPLLIPLSQPSTSADTDKSPFLSNKLDEFLTENSKLNISYNVPQSGAEAGLRPSYRETSPVMVPAPAPVVEMDVMEERPKVVNRMKAKTVAQKRQMLEETGVLARTERKEVLKEFKRPVRNEVARNKMSYVLYNNKRIYVRSISLKKCVATIKDKHLKKPKVLKVQKHQVQKPTLLSALKGDDRRVTYRPGPLCDKILLQSDNFDWETHVMKLPKIYLDIEAEVGKEVPPHLMHLLPKNEGKINKSQIEFALSSLPNTEGKIYRFPVKYANNAQNIVVRKAKSHRSLPVKVKDEDVDVEITNILDDLIKYVEVKEISDGLVKEDEERESGPGELRSNSPKKRKGKTRVQLELTRLNCNVINMSLDQPKPEQLDCNMQHCKFGCVCESLYCNPILSDHCNKIDCMFECSCATKPHLSQESVSVSVLNTSGTINGLEDRLSQDLAREEKAFTQTVIQADDKTIFFAKPRRSAKAPNKFGEYVAEPVVVKLPSEIARLKQDARKSKGFVKLANYNLKSLVLYCMQHQTYNCYYCGDNGKMMKHKLADEPKPELLLPVKRKDKHRKNVDKDYIVLKKRIEMLKKRQQVLAQQAAEKVKQSESGDSDVNIIDDSPIREEPPTVSGSRKRKQSFEVRKDVVIPPAPTPDRKQLAMQRRKKRMKYLSSGTEMVQTVFEGEVIIDRHDTLKQLGAKALAAGYARFVPFKSLVQCYKEKLVRLWYISDQSHRIMLASSDNAPPLDCEAVDGNYKCNAIASWILNDILPERYLLREVFLILISNRGAYEICGVSQHNFKGKPNSQTGKVDNTFEHRDKDDILRVMTLDKKDFLPVKLHVVETGKIKKFIMMPVVNGPENRWKMLQFNAPFSYIEFPDINYSIQYRYLVAIKRMTELAKQTIVLKATRLTASYLHPDFGIYFPPYKKNFIFIGPYRGRTLNVGLDRADSGANFWDLMQLAVGNFAVPSTSAQTSLLKCQQKAAIVTKKLATPVANPVSVPVLHIPEKRTMSTEYTNYFSQAHDDKFIVLDAPPKQPHEFNLFFLTNVVGFGYLGAITYAGKAHVDISWPFENKILRFKFVELAKNFLQERFRALVQPIPIEFQLSVHWQAHLDLAKYSPINPEIFNGYFVCGKFGIYNINTIPASQSKKLIGISKDELKVIFNVRAATFLRKRVIDFGKHVRLAAPNVLESLGVSDILDMAIKQIQHLKELNERRRIFRIKAEQKRDVLLTRANYLARNSPQAQQRIHDIINEKKNAAIETIEILDDSDEENGKMLDEEYFENISPMEVDKPPSPLGKLNMNKELDIFIPPSKPPQTSLLKKSTLNVAKPPVYVTIDPSPSTSSKPMPKVFRTIARKIDLPSTSASPSPLKTERLHFLQIKDGKIVNRNQK